MDNPKSGNTISRVGFESALDGPAPYESFHHPYFPKFSSLSKSHWELWIFDGVDPDGKTAVTMTFFRDGSQLKMGKGPLRVTFQATLPDGTTVRGEDYSKESVVEAQTERIRGSWLSQLHENKSVQFAVASDLSEAVVTFDLPDIQGTLKLRGAAASAPVRDMLSDNASNFLAPAVYYSHTLPRALAEVSFTFPEKGKSLQFSGFGGGDHCWMLESTPIIMEACTYARGHVGPYTFALFRIVSRLDPEKSFLKATLVQDDRVIFTCTSDDAISLKDDYISFRSINGGAVRGAYSDSSSGYKLDLVSPSTQQHWSFQLKHQILWWSMPTAPPPAKTGNNGFVDVVSGGKVGEAIYSGSATVGHVELPFLKSQYSGFNNHS